MASRKEFLRLLWNDLINSWMRETWIDGAIKAHETSPKEPFADIGEVLKRLLALGASRRDLSLLQRQSSYEAVFQLLYMLDDPGIEGDDFAMLHESLLTADPSGMDGRPGSAPEKGERLQGGKQ